MILTAWLGAMLCCIDGTSRITQTPVPGREPVLLVHGIGDDHACMLRMANYLRSEGWEVHTLDLTPNWGQKGLVPLARQVSDFADAHFGKKRFNLVGFSMGGLVTRYYMQRLGGIGRVDHYITLAAPHNGTITAHFIPNTGCREMRPGSEFLRDLERDADRLRKVKFTSFYTKYDLVIRPARSSVMPQAKNVAIPVLSHPGMVLRKPSLQAVAQALAS